MSNKELVKIVGDSLFYAAIIFSLGSVEMSSKFSVINFAKDQATLDRARDALESFIYVSAVWIVATVLSLYASYSWCGAAFALLFGCIITASIIWSYFKSFEQAANEYKLKYPETFTKRTWFILIGTILTLQMYCFYKCGYLGFLEK
mgnify:CR=1 FL=1